MTAIRSSAPAIRVAPKAAVRATAPAASTAAPAPIRKPAVPAKAQAMPELSARNIGTVGGLAAGGTVGYLFGSVLASGGMSAILPIALLAAGAALFAKGGAVIGDAIAGRAKKPTLAQGIVGGVSGTVLGAAIWGVTAFAGGMAMVPWVFVAAIPMGIAAAVLGGTAIGSFVPGRK